MRPKIVLVGTGRFGANHLRNLLEFDKKGIIKLLGVADTDLRALKTVEKKNKIKTSTDYRDFIGVADAFDVVTPASTHYEIVKNLLYRKKHVFVEKPLALSFKDANNLAKFADKNKLVLQVGLIFRYNKSVEVLRKIIKKTPPFYVTGSFLQSTQPKKDVGAIFNYLHHFDILDNLFGSNVKSISSHANLFSENPILETNVTVLLEFKNNPKVVLNLGWIPTGKFRTIEFFSKINHVKCDLMTQKIEIFQWKNPIKIMQCKFSEPLNLELMDFVKCIKSKKQPRANGKIGARVVKLAETAKKSLETGRVISLK